MKLLRIRSWSWVFVLAVVLMTGRLVVGRLWAAPAPVRVIPVGTAVPAAEPAPYAVEVMRASPPGELPNGERVPAGTVQ